MNKWHSHTRLTIAAGAALMLLGVLFGAFGAHTLKTRLAPEMLAAYQTGVQYHLIHALGLMVVGLLCNLQPDSNLFKAAAVLMFCGVLLFSGSLYALAISGVLVLGAITPLGGLCFLLAWGLVIWLMLRGA